MAVREDLTEFEEEVLVEDGMHCEECGERCAWTPLGICGSCQQSEDRERAGL